MRALIPLLMAGCAAFDCAEWTEPEAGPAPAPRPLDLLSRIDPARDALKGEWAVENGGLVARRAPAALRLPPAAAFTLVLAADRPLFARLTVGGRSVELSLTADRPRTLEWSSAGPQLDGEPTSYVESEGPDSLSATTAGLMIRTLTASKD